MGGLPFDLQPASAGASHFAVAPFRPSFRNQAGKGRSAATRGTALPFWVTAGLLLLFRRGRPTDRVLPSRCGSCRCRVGDDPASKIALWRSFLSLGESRNDVAQDTSDDAVVAVDIVLEPLVGGPAWLPL